MVLVLLGFPDGTVVKNPPVNAGDSGDADLIPGLGRFPGEGNATHSSSHAGNLMDREPGGLQSA